MPDGDGRRGEKADSGRLTIPTGLVRLEYLPSIGRAADGRIGEIPIGRGEPDPYGVPTDLYCPGYEVRSRLFGRGRIVRLWVTIYNTRTYRPDPELEEAAKEGLIREILAKEGPEAVDWAGGKEELKARVQVDTFWREWNGVEPPWNRWKAKRDSARHP